MRLKGVHTLLTSFLIKERCIIAFEKYLEYDRDDIVR